MRALLVNPPYRRLRRAGAVYFPIGLGYLAAVLEKAGHEAKIYNGEVPQSREENESGKYKGGDFSYIMSTHGVYLKNLEDDNFFVWQEFKKSLDDFRPDMVGVSVRTPMFGSAVKISRLVKEWNKNCPVVWGGAHPTILPEESTAIPEVDFSVRGEGEETILDLIKTLEAGMIPTGVMGVCYKSDGEVIINPIRGYIKDLDKLPFPARHLVFKEDLYPPDSFLDLMASRGCPFLCTYCSAHSMWGRNVRYRSVPNIIEEVAVLKNQYGCGYLRFIDDNLTLNRPWIEELCENMISRRFDLKWGCLTRATLIDEKLLKLMIKAECYRIDIGVESGSPGILKMMKKNINLDDVSRVDKLFGKYGIDWTAFFITGFPYETREDLAATAKFMKKINPYRIVLSNFTPYPGTEDYEKAKEMGTLPQKIDWSLLDHNSPDNFFMKNVGREEYQKFFQKLSDYVSSRNTRRIRGKEIYYLRHPFSLARKTVKFIKNRI